MILLMKLKDYWRGEIMRLFNYGEHFKTKVAKGNIKENTFVKVVDQLDFETKCIVEDNDGNKEEYTNKELIDFICFNGFAVIYEVTQDYENGIGKDKNGNSNCIYARKHYSESIRSEERYLSRKYDKYYQVDPVQSSNKFIYFNYQYQNYDDNKAVEIILNEAIYGVLPYIIQITVGYNKKGLDFDIKEEKKATLLLTNNKEYSISLQRGLIKISTDYFVYKGELDWNRWREAVIKNDILDEFRRDSILIKEIPELYEFMYQKYNTKDKYKFSWEKD